MKIGIYHGYELTGSGSNEFTRYLARALMNNGHDVHIICQEPCPEAIPFLTHYWEWALEGCQYQKTLRSDTQTNCILHKLPEPPVKPVYVTDKQRTGNVKAFVDLSRQELNDYHLLNETVLYKLFETVSIDVLHANHLVYQPIAALKPAQKMGIPMVIYPHGSSMEYVLKRDSRFNLLVLETLLESAGLIVGNQEVLSRVLHMYPQHSHELASKTQIVSVGVDTELFDTVSRGKRYSTIQKLKHYDGPFGKTWAQSQELFDHLDAGHIDYTQAYWQAYKHDAPDADLINKVEAIDWQNEKIILFVGSFTSGKGVQSLITAMPEVLAHNPRAHLVLIGAGAYREVLEGYAYALATHNQDLIGQFAYQGIDLDRGNATGRWEDVIAYLSDEANLHWINQYGPKLKDKVTFLGRMEHSLLQYVFPCADVCVFPSIIPEAYPLVLIESLANGVLPMVSYFSGFAESVDELASDLDASLIDKMKISMDTPKRIRSMVDHLNGLLAESDDNQYRQKLREVVAERYDWHTKAQQMANAYQHVIDSNTTYTSHHPSDHAK